MKKVLSIDLNSKNARVAIINQYGEIEAKTVIENDVHNLINNLSLQTKLWLKNAGYDYHLDVERIGFVVPGIVNHRQGIVKLVDEFNWKEFPLRKTIQKEFKTKRIYLLNNASAKALGEFWTGAATNYNSELFYNLSQKISSAIVINGKLILGENGFAGDFGNSSTMNEENENYTFKNCFETLTSTGDLSKRVVKIFQENPTHPAYKYFASALHQNNLDFKIITRIYHRHSKPRAIKELLKQILEPLIIHISVMISAIDPKAVIIGGDILALGRDLLQIIQESLAPLIPNFEKKTLVLKQTSLGQNAGLVGVAYFAINNNWDE